MSATNPRTVRVRWFFLALVAVVLLVGTIYAITSQGWSMFLVSLGLAAGLSLLFVILPVAFFLILDFGCMVIGKISGTVITALHKLGFRKR